MKGFERLSDELHEEGGPDELRRVFLIARDGRVEDPNPNTRFDLQAIALRFDRFSCTIVCRAEFDQVEFLVDERLPWPDTVVTENSGDPPWRDVIGGFFFADFWRMTNYKGYEDAVQVKFMSLDRTDTSEHIIQLEAVASGYYISRLDWGLWRYNPTEHFPDD